LTEFDKYVDPTVVLLKELENKPNSAIELWMNEVINGVNYTNFDVYFNLFYKNILQYMHLDINSINTSIWQDELYLQSVYTSLDAKYTDIDIFIINNTGSSNQYKDNKPLNNLAKYLNTKYNILVTQSIDNSIKCTFNLTVQQYGAISTRSKYIISVWSGSCTGCYNSLSKDYVKKWFFLSDIPTIHSTINSESINNNNIDKIKTYFDNLSQNKESLVAVDAIAEEE